MTPRTLTLAVTAALASLLLPVAVASAAAPARSRPAAATTGTAAAPDSWVTHVGPGLQLDGRPWRFSGVDMYWLGLDDNVQDAQGPTYPSHERIDDGFAAARALGARVVRAHTLGISVGSPRSVEPSRGVFDDSAFDSIDYAVASARRHGLRLMVPLTDQWHYYHGGKHTFTAWRGYADLPGQDAATSDRQRAAESHFYSDPVVVADFQAYVAHVLDHVDAYTGRRLGDDATLAVWETGNELWDAPPSWTELTARFIHSRAPRALVADGSAATGMHVTGAALDAPDVDIVGGHFYPPDPAWAAADARAAAAAGKAYVVGEEPLTGPGAGTWLAGLAADPHVAGDLAWTLLPHLADGTPEPHGDGYALHVPGATPAEQAADTLLVAHTLAMAGPPAPAVALQPANLLRAAGVATGAAGPDAYGTGTTGTTPPLLAGSGTSRGYPVLRLTARSAGFSWVYPGRPTDGAPVAPGATCTATVSARLVAGVPGPPAGLAHLTWYDAGGRYLSGVDGAATALAPGSWQPLVVTGRAPAGAAWAVPQWQAEQAAVTGDAVELDEFGVSAGTTALPWHAPGA